MELSKIETRRICIDVPKKINELEIDQQYVQEAMIALLFHTGKMTSKEACEILGVARRVFEEDILAKYGFTVMRNSDKNTEIEFGATQW